MSAEPTHVIKRHTVSDSEFERVDPSLFTRPARIPKSEVSVREECDEQESGYKLDRLLRSRHASALEKPVEVVTRREQPMGPEPVEPAEPEEPEPEPTMDEIEANWQARLDADVAAARQQGIESGKQEAEAAYREELERIADEFARHLGELQDAWKKFVSRAEVDLTQLAFRIARAVLDGPLPAGVRKVSEEAIVDAVEAMADDVPLEVAVHPVTYLRLQEAGLEEHLSRAHQKLRWKSDADLKENEWVVQSNRAAVRRIEAELLAQIQRELAVRQLTDEDPPAGGPSDAEGSASTNAAGFPGADVFDPTNAGNASDAAVSGPDDVVDPPNAEQSTP